MGLSFCLNAEVDSAGSQLKMSPFVSSLDELSVLQTDFCFIIKLKVKPFEYENKQTKKQHQNLENSKLCSTDEKQKLKSILGNSQIYLV